MEEIWKPVLVEGYSLFYEVSNFGNVRRKSSGRVLKKYLHYKGYHLVTLHGIKQKSFTVHRLVAMAFIKNELNKPQVNHMNGRKIDNWVGNLEWVNQSENQIHAYKLKIQSQGIRL